MIMVVTFQDEFRQKISSFLSEKGYEVCIPSHRADVFPMVKEKNPFVIVLDMYVAEPSGLEVLRELRGQSYGGKVVALAGSSLSSSVAQAFKLGVDQVIGGFHSPGSTLLLDQVESSIKRALQPHIARRAFELYEARGRAQGNHLDDWLEAERQIFKKDIPLSSGEREVKAEPERPPKKRTKTPKKLP